MNSRLLILSFLLGLIIFIPNGVQWTRKILAYIMLSIAIFCGILVLMNYLFAYFWEP